MDLVVFLHSHLRFVILFVAIIGIVKTLIALSQKSEPAKFDQILGAIFVHLYDLQALLGILIIFLGGLRAVIHPIVMFIGLVMAHWLNIQTRKAQGANANLTRLGLYVIPLMIILFGLAIIGQLRLF